MSHCNCHTEIVRDGSGQLQRYLKALDPAYDDRKALQEEVDDCVTLSQGRGVAEAGVRGEHRAYYACGAVFAMTAEGAQNRAGRTKANSSRASNRSRERGGVVRPRRRAVRPA